MIGKIVVLAVDFLFLSFDLFAIFIKVKDDTINILPTSQFFTVGSVVIPIFLVVRLKMATCHDLSRQLRFFGQDTIGICQISFTIYFNTCISYLTPIIFIVVVILAINGDFFTFCLDAIVMEVEVKAIDGLWASQFVALAVQVIPVTLII